MKANPIFIKAKTVFLNIFIISESRLQIDKWNTGLYFDISLLVSLREIMPWQWSFIWMSKNNNEQEYYRSRLSMIKIINDTEYQWSTLSMFKNVNNQLNQWTILYQWSIIYIIKNIYDQEYQWSRILKIKNIN